MKKITILVSTACSIIFPGITNILRNNKEYEFRIIGMDARDRGAANIHADKFYPVPMGNEDRSYIDKVLSICERENVDIVLPISDEENLTLSKYLNEFKSRSIKVLVNSHDKTALALNKLKAMQFLRDNGIKMPDWRAPKSVEELEAQLYELGYPEKKVVIKPVQTRGSRGFHIIDANHDEVEQFMGKQGVFTSKSYCIDILKKAPIFPKIFLMEYLPGTSYSIDILANEGEMLACLPHNRLGYKWGRLDHAIIEHNDACYDMCKQIVEVFEFDNLINIELGISVDGDPLLIEINPRASATLALNSMTGIDILHHAVKIQMDGADGYAPMSYKWAEYVISDLNTLLEKEK